MPSTASSARPRVALRSIDRTMTMSDDHWFMIAHVMLVRGATDALVRLAPAALLKTFNKHPRMRLTTLKDAFDMAEVSPPLVSLDELTDRKLLHITKTNDLSLEACRAFIPRVGHTPYNRYTQFPFQLHIWVDSARDRARPVLFSDHYAADGSSGMTVLNDFLSFASELARGESTADDMPQEKPIRECLYDAFLGPHTILSPMLRAIGALAGRTLLSLAPRPTHVLPPNDRQEPFRREPPQNPSIALLADGTPENMKQILAKCRAEGTTFTGALSAAVFLSYMLASDSLESHAFKLKWAIAVNMRQRVDNTPYDKDDVGSFSFTSDMETPPIDVPAQTFWDLARSIKAAANDAIANTTAMAMAFILTDQNIHRKADTTPLEATPIEGGTFSELDVSSLGKYDHATTHAFGAKDELAVESLHFVGRLPLLTALCQVFVTSVDHVGYAMNHHYDEATGQALFTNVVKIMESCWKIESHDRLADVLAKLLP